MVLNGTNPSCSISGLNDNILAAPNRTAAQRARDDRADSTQRKGAIDEQARLAEIALWVRPGEFGRERVL